MNFKTRQTENQVKAFKKSKDMKPFGFLCWMGTGKTKMIIDNASYLFDAKKIELLLVVAPNGVHVNWIEEMKKHCSSEFIMHIWNGKKTKKQKDLINNLLKMNYQDRLKVLAVNIESLSQKGFAYDTCKQFLDSHATLAVIDESTRIKNHTASRTKNLLRLSKLTEYKRIATGMIVGGKKDPSALFTQLNFLDPNILGLKNYYAFRSKYVNYIMQYNPKTGCDFPIILGTKNLDELKERMAPYVYIITEEDAEKDLPEKIRQKRYVHLTSEQRKVYDEIKEKVLTLLNNGEVIKSQLMITKMLKMQEICGGFVTTENGQKNAFKSNPKLKEMMHIIEESDSKTVIWAKFRWEIETIVTTLRKKYGAESVVEHWGGIDKEISNAAPKIFQENDKVRFFVGNIQKGSGYNLFKANLSIYYSDTFSLEDRVQSEKRLHRMGQNRPVVYINLVAVDTIDEMIPKSHQEKKNFSVYLMDVKEIM